MSVALERKVGPVIAAYVSTGIDRQADMPISLSSTLFSYFCVHLIYRKIFRGCRISRESIGRGGDLWSQARTAVEDFVVYKQIPNKFVLYSWADRGASKKGGSRRGSNFRPNVKKPTTWAKKGVRTPWTPLFLLVNLRWTPFSKILDPPLYVVA